MSQEERDDSLEKTKQQIRGLVGEIAQLSKSDLSPEEYYAAFLQRVIQALAAVGGAVWVMGEGGRPQLSYQINISPGLLDSDSEDASKHFRLLDYILASKEPKLIPPMSSASDERVGGNPTNQLLVVAPMGHDGQVEGLVEIFQRPDTQPATQRGYLKFLVQMCELTAEWLKNRKLRHFSDRHSLWAQADQFSKAVHESLDIRETCYTIVNEGRRLLGCDRVTIAILRRGHCRVEAVSGQDTMDNRSNVVTLLGKLATRVVASGEPLWYSGSTEDFPPQIEQAIEAYVDQSYTKSLAVIPLRKPHPADTAPEQQQGAAADNTAAPTGEIVGALIIEQIESDIPRDVLNPRLDLVYEHSSRALTNTLDHNSLFLMPLWRAIGKSKWVVQARTLPKTIAITAAVLVALVASIAVPWDFDMRAKGALQPVTKSNVYAPADARVVEVKVDSNDAVEAEQILAILESDELKQQINKVAGDLASAKEQVSSLLKQILAGQGRMTEAERERVRLEYNVAVEKVKNAQDELTILHERQDALTIRSPIAGRIVTWDVKRTLERRPVGVGQVLMTVAAEGTEYEVELFMPERRVKHLTNYRNRVKERDASEDLDVDFILMTDPGVYYKGKIAEVNPAAEPHEEHGNMVRIKVMPDPSNPVKNPRPGTTVTADVHCGKAPFIYSMLHEAWEWLEANVLF
jgi:multidrug efflux pump subunit AcrA (membrane-fusion protein)